MMGPRPLRLECDGLVGPLVTDHMRRCYKAPDFDANGMATNGGVEFGAGDAMTIANTAGINEAGNYTQKQAFAFETGSSVSGDHQTFMSKAAVRAVTASIAKTRQQARLSSMRLSGIIQNGLPRPV